MIINWAVKNKRYYGANIIVFRFSGYSVGGLTAMASFFSTLTHPRFHSSLKQPVFLALHQKPTFFSSLKMPGFKSLLRKDKFHR